MDLHGSIAGSYTGKASSAYLYYTDEFKSWCPGLQVVIRPQRSAFATYTRNSTAEGVGLVAIKVETAEAVL